MYEWYDESKLHFYNYILIRVGINFMKNSMNSINAGIERLKPVALTGSINLTLIPNLTATIQIWSVVVRETGYKESWKKRSKKEDILEND